jgi:hypothetical protein
MTTELRRAVHRRRLTAVAALCVCCAVMVPARPAAAASDGGASTRVVGRGDIVTSILGWTSGVRRGTTTAPTCVWRTLNDAQLEWLIEVAAHATELQIDSAVLDPVRAHMDGTTPPDQDVRALVCGADVVEFRFVPASTPADTTQLLVRQMITHLPAPRPVLSPREGVVVPVHQPVFVSLPDEQWQPLAGSITYAGVTAEVRASPVAVRLFSGDPATDATTCAGPGRPFRAGGGSPRAQSQHPLACVMTYRSATVRPHGTAPRSTPRPAGWLGTVTVMWSAQWRSDGGAWNDLGLIPRTRLISRGVRELDTALEWGRP